MLTPVAAILPAVWVIALLVLDSSSVPEALISWPIEIPVAPDRVKFAPERAASVVNVPPLLNLRSAFPVLIALDGRVKVPAAISDSSLLAPRVSAPIDRLPEATILTPLAVGPTAPPNVLPAFSSVSLWPAMEKLLAPPTDNAPLCVRSVVVVRLKPPPTFSEPSSEILLAPVKLA